LCVFKAFSHSLILFRVKVRFRVRVMVRVMVWVKVRVMAKVRVRVRVKVNLFAARIFKNPVESIIYDVAEFSRE
jgi:hypothetical protein